MCFLSGELTHTYTHNTPLRDGFIIFNNIYVCGSVCGIVCVRTNGCRDLRCQIPLDQDLLIAVGHRVGVLGLELESLERVICALNF